MKFNTQFKFELDLNFESVETPEQGSAYGVVKIGDFYEHFYMSSSWWSVEDYLRQWNMAFERLNAGENTSCFIVNIQPINCLIAAWVVYREEGVLYIQNKYFFGDFYRKIIGDKSVTPESSFDFIQRRKTVTEEGKQISEWSVKIV